jgi:hypothetical protein
MKENKIDYLITKNNEKLLPWQYYNKFNYITIPMVDKRVLIPNWQNKKETVIPNYLTPNIGILAGENSNLLVLDIDVKDNGIQLWNDLYKKNLKFKTPTVKTPSGGLHFYFKYNSNIPTMNRILVNNNKIGWDIKSNNSIIVAPPSIHFNKRYKWIISLNDCKPISMPKWLENFILSNLKESTKKRLELK